MNRFPLFFGIIIIILLVMLGILYYVYEIPKQQIEEEIKVNITIYTFDNETKQQISTGINIYKDGNLLMDEKSLDGGGLFLSFSTNHTYHITNYNLNNQNYYTSYLAKKFYGWNYSIERFDLYLNKPGELNYLLLEDADYSHILELSSNNRLIRNTSICIKGSTNIIGLTAKSDEFNLTLIEKINKYRDYDKCYYIGDIYKDKIIIKIYPKAYLNIDTRDFIQLVITDKDCFAGTCYDEDETVDYGMKDIIINKKLL